MKMFLTRFGENSKMIITGDITQIDLPSKNKSGLKDAINNLKKIKDISFVYLTEKDVVRHSIVREGWKGHLPHAHLRVKTLRCFGIDDGSETHRTSSRFIYSARSHDYDAWERLKI